jgi:hypothetical protein
VRKPRVAVRRTRGIHREISSHSLHVEAFFMTISGTVSEADWSVSAEVDETDGGYACRIRVSHRTPDGVFTHEFKHSRIFATEREAVLDGLREGMVWVELKQAKTFHV